MVLDKWFKHRQNQESSQKENSPDRLLPSDVRFALNHREARLSIQEIRDLNRNGFKNEALYLLMKSVENDPEQQFRFMSELVGDLSQEDHEDPAESSSPPRDRVNAFLNTAIEQLPRDTQVLGTKLAQLSRQGFDHWKSIYEQAAERHAQSSSSTFLVGHATFVGLAAFIDSHARVGKPLHILIPSLINNPESDTCGYRIYNGHTEMLKKDFVRDAAAVVIDDTKNTGESSKNVELFWTAGGEFPSPQFEFLTIVQNSHS